MPMSSDNSVTRPIWIKAVVVALVPGQLSMVKGNLRKQIPWKTCENRGDCTLVSKESLIRLIKERNNIQATTSMLGCFEFSSTNFTSQSPLMSAFYKFSGCGQNLDKLFVTM
jgi:hypothetical protein